MHAGLGPASIIHASFFSQIYLGLHCRQSKWVHGLHTNWNQGERRSQMSQRIQDWWSPCGMSQGKGWVGLTVCWWCHREKLETWNIYIILLLYIYYYLYIYLSIDIFIDIQIQRWGAHHLLSPFCISQWDWQTPGWSKWTSRTSHGVSDWNYIGKTFVPYIYMQYIYIYIYIYTYIYIYIPVKFRISNRRLPTYIHISISIQ